MKTSTQIKLLLGLVGAILVLVVAAQNSGTVDLRLLFWDTTVDRLVLFPALFGAGVAVGWLLSWVFRKRRGARDRP